MQNYFGLNSAVEFSLARKGREISMVSNSSTDSSGISLIEKALLTVSLVTLSLTVPSSISSYAQVALAKGKLASPSMQRDSRTTEDGAAFVTRMLSTADALKDYSFDSNIITFKGRRRVSQKGKFFFKQPNLTRIEVTKGGFRKGSVLVREKSGNIIARGGGLFRAVKLRMKKNNKWLRSANGFSMLEVDYETLLRNLTRELKHGQKSYVTESPVKAGVQKKNVYILDVIDPAKSKDRITQRVLVDPQKNLPIEWHLFRKAKPLSITKWSNIKTNSGLSDELFKL